MKKESEMKKKEYYIFDCKTGNFGRIATRAASILQGKHKATYLPNRDMGDYVVLINAGDARYSGNKTEKKKYHSFSGYPGGITSRKLGELLKRAPEKLAQDVIYNMLPKNKLRDKMIKKLKVYSDNNHGLNVELKVIK